MSFMYQKQKGTPKVRKEGKGENFKRFKKQGLKNETIDVRFEKDWNCLKNVTAEKQKTVHNITTNLENIQWKQNQYWNFG